MTQNQRYNSQRRAVLLDPTPAAVDKGRGGRLKDANVLLKHSNKNRELNTIVCVWGGRVGRQPWQWANCIPVPTMTKCHI